MDDWYYAVNNEAIGPITLVELRQRYAAGSPAPTDLVWQNGDKNSRPALQVLGTPGTPQAFPTAPPAPVSQLAYSSTGEMITLTLGAQQALRATRPWVRFISIMMFIGSGLILLAGLAMAIAGMVEGSKGAPIIGMGIAYMFGSLIYIGPAVFLTHYASHLRKAEDSHDPNDIEAAMLAQKSFWKFIGILMIVVMVLYALIIVGAIIVGVAASLHGHAGI